MVGANLAWRCGRRYQWCGFFLDPAGLLAFQKTELEEHEGNEGHEELQQQMIERGAGSRAARPSRSQEPFHQVPVGPG